MNILKIVLFAGAVAILSGCGKEVVDESEQAPVGENVLNIFTRAEGAEGASAVIYPVQVYAFNGSSKCVATQTIAGENEELSLSLNNGTYTVYAIGGAQSDRYALPTQDEATPESPLTLTEGMTLDDLQAAKGTVTLNKEANNLTLLLKRKVMLLQEVTIEKVPTTVTAVSVSLQPLYEALLLNGDYSGEAGNGSVTLTRQADGTTWKNTEAGHYLLPSIGNPSITIRFTVDGQTTGYTYACDEEMDANHHVSITGTYTGGGFLVSGTLTAEDWGEDKIIAFTFNETNKADNNGNSNTGGGNNDNADLQSLAVGDTYKDCFVLAKTAESITLLSKTEENNVLTEEEGTDPDKAKQKVDARLATWAVDGVSATWRLPKRSEIELITEKYNEILNDKNEDGRYDQKTATYFYLEGSGVNAMIISRTVIGKTSYSGGIITTSTLLRPVATIPLN